MNAVEQAFAEVLPDVVGSASRVPVLVDGDVIGAGRRNAHLASLAGSMRRRGMSAEAMAAALIEENVRRCHPPLLEAEVRGIASSVGRYAPTVERIDGARYNVLDDVTLLSRPTPEQLAIGRIPARSLGALIGATETWKTFVDLALLCGVLHSGQWLGTTVKRGRALKVLAEGASGYKDRLVAWKAAHALAPDFPLGLQIVEEAVNLFDPSEVDRFIDEVIAPRAPLDIVNIDTLARCSVGMDENSARDMGIVVRSADRIREAAQGVVLLNHHVNAAETKERGSSALRGACDFILRTSKTDDMVTLSCDKQKDMEPFEPVKLKLVPVDGTKSCIVRIASDVLSGGELTPSQRTALDALVNTFGSDGATGAEWETALPGMAKRTYYRCRTVLVERGYVDAKGSRFVARRRSA